MTRLIIFALSLSLLAGGRVTAAPDGSLTDPHLQFIGRWDKSNPAERHSYWTAPYLRTGFTGTSVSIRLAEGTTLNVSLDGETPRTLSAGAGVTVLNAAPLAPGRHTLLVGGAAQNEEVRFLGLGLAPGAATVAVPVRPLIEFVGDSITAGGADNYAWLAAEALGCDHAQIAFSGVALTSGYGCVSKVGLDAMYFRLKNYNHLDEAPPVPWQPAAAPRVLVINLGQNDQCGNEPADVMTASYARFLRHLRAIYPKTQLVALRPFGGPYAASIRQAVTAVRASGDARVQYVDTTGWLAPADFRDGIHPNTLGNQKVAARLAPLLKPLLL